MVTIKFNKSVFIRKTKFIFFRKIDESDVQRVQCTPELNRLIIGNNQTVVANSKPSSPIALAPYQRLSSLPPTGYLPKTNLNEGFNSGNTFGTLQVCLFFLIVFLTFTTIFIKNKFEKVSFKNIEFIGMCFFFFKK